MWFSLILLSLFHSFFLFFPPLANSSNISLRVVSWQISQTENPQKIEFALFWCKGSPWGVIQESRRFLLSDPYFGFYGGLKFWPPWVPLKLWKAISQPFFMRKGQSWCQSSCINPKNMLVKKFEPKIVILGVFTPRGSTPGYPRVPST